MNEEENDDKVNGIVIEEEDFRLTNVKNTLFYDLELKKVVKPKNGPERTEWYTTSYGISLPHALKIVVLDRMKKQNPTQKWKMDEFFDAYNNQLEKLLQYA